MHACITTLLGNVDAPRGEDIECLCKLLATVGRPLDQSVAKTRPLMEVYFQRIDALSKSAALDSRLRFLLKDLIDLRNNQWVERRKKEGPKTIDEIHREARDELARQRAADMRQGPGSDRRGGGQDRRGSGPPAERRPPRFASEVEAPIRPMARAGSHEMFGAASSLRPGGAGGAAAGGGGASGSGAFARVAAGAGLGPRAQPFGKQALSPSSSTTPPPSSAVAAVAAATAAKVAAAKAADSEKKEAEASAAASALAAAASPPPATTPSAVSRAASPAPSAAALSPAEEAARSRAKTLAVEFQSLGSLKEVDATLAELGISTSAVEAEEGASDGAAAAAAASPSQPLLPEAEAAAATAALVDELFLTAYGLKGLDRAKFQELVAHVAQASAGAKAGVPRAVRLVLDTLEGEAEDAPFAPALVGEASAGFVVEGLLSLKEFAQTLLAAGIEEFEGEEEEEVAANADAEKVLMESGTTSKVLAATLSALAKRKGADEAKAAWAATGLSLKSFLPKDDREIDALADDLAKDCGLN